MLRSSLVSGSPESHKFIVDLVMINTCKTMVNDTDEDMRWALYVMPVKNLKKGRLNHKNFQKSWIMRLLKNKL